MSQESKNITINILPQSSDAWFYIALAVVAFTVPSCVKESYKSQMEVEKSRLEVKK